MLILSGDRFSVSTMGLLSGLNNSDALWRAQLDSSKLIMFSLSNQREPVIINILWPIVVDEAVFRMTCVLAEPGGGTKMASEPGASPDITRGSGNSSPWRRGSMGTGGVVML